MWWIGCHSEVLGVGSSHRWDLNNRWFFSSFSSFLPPLPSQVILKRPLRFLKATSSAVDTPALLLVGPSHRLIKPYPRDSHWWNCKLDCRQSNLENALFRLWTPIIQGREPKRASKRSINHSSPGGSLGTPQQHPGLADVPSFPLGT